MSDWTIRDGAITRNTPAVERDVAFLRLSSLREHPHHRQTDGRRRRDPWATLPKRLPMAIATPVATSPVAGVRDPIASVRGRQPGAWQEL